MRVADSFARAGFHVIQSEYYSDPRTNAPREIDLYASLQRDVARTFFRLAIFAECKSGKSKPWIVFASPRVSMADRARVVQRSSTMMGHSWLREISLRKDVSELPIFQLPETPGYGVAAAFTEGGVDIPYAAIMGAASAADSDAQAGDKSPRGLFFSVHFPLVITDAPLFVCSLGNGRTPEVERVDKAVLAWRNPAYGLPHCIVHVVHASAIDAFVKQTMADFVFLLSQTEKEIERVLSDPIFKQAANRRPRTSGRSNAAPASRRSKKRPTPA